MVALSEVTASNQRVAASFPDGLVAVFVGATSGVGEYTVKAFAKYVPSPRVYIVGRSRDAANQIINECLESNPRGAFEFIQADVSLLKNVDDVCQKIKSKETAINLLFESQGSMAFTKVTSEGLPLAFSLVAHSRLRFIVNLLPLLQEAKTLRRIVNVAAASCEGPINLDNIPALGLPLRSLRDHSASVLTLLLEEVARRAPEVSFVHTVPGVVKSGIMRDMEPNLRLSIIVAISKVLSPFINTSPDECAERLVFLATTARFPPRKGGIVVSGVSLGEHLTVARGSDGQVGTGIYTVDNKGESSPIKVEQLLLGFRENGTAAKVWEYVMDDFLRITGTEASL